MNKVIMEFSNVYFYEGKLKAHESNIAHHIIPDDAIIEFIDTAGTGFEETQDSETLSRFNQGEVDIFLEHIYQLIDLVPNFSELSVGIVSPYKEQTSLIKRTIEEDSVLQEFVNIDVDTIDSFQGQERDLIYILLVRSNAKGEIGFLNDYRRMNVAMTRAKKKLVIIGDSATIGNDPYYQQFIDYVEKEGAYKTAWEYMQ
jgi:superfamily I DNA and/or RNA helicase